MSDYLSYWKADTAVFLRQIPTESLFIPAALRQSLELLRYFCTTEAPQLMVLTGECGTGKSTLLRWLAAELPTSTHDLLTLSLVSDEYGPGWLAPRLAAALGAPATGQDPRLAMASVAQRLDELVEQKRQLIVVIDSAHLVRTSGGLQEILAILNIQTLSVRCVSFVIAGEPHLMEPLAEIHGLSGKIALHINLAPLTFEETQAYLSHRLRLAGLRDPFEEAAIRILYQRSQGVMLSTDIFAEHCLIEAAAQRLPRVTAAVAQGAARHLPKPQATTLGRATRPAESSDSTRKREDETSVIATHPPTQPSPLKQDPIATQGNAEDAAQDLDRASFPAVPPPPPTFPDPPKPSPDGMLTTLEPSNGENTPAHAGSTSIRLSSLFKSLPSPPKPKKGS